MSQQSPPSENGPDRNSPSSASASTAEDERSLVAALRNGDEMAFITVLNRYHTPLLRLARIYVPDQAVAEEVVQETWMGLLQGIQRFEERSSLKTWLFHILMNRAKTHAQREGRSIPFSSLPGADGEQADAGIEADRFFPLDHPERPGHWVSFPQSWDEIPEERLLSQETRSHIEQAIRTLPPAQREVITLRDVEGWTSDEVCDFLGISQANQRVLLHRARAQVRRALEQYLHEE
jgi:RNA polymerase sigma-70 factor (ECF subfamily)